MDLPPEGELLRANQAFYDAFAARDIEAMDELWARSLPVTCVHPGWTPLLGREDVMSSWRSILLGGSAPEISCSAAHPGLLGAAGVVTCVEHIGLDSLVATNVFALEEGIWQLVHHHAGPIAASDEAPPDTPLN